MAAHKSTSDPSATMEDIEMTTSSPQETKHHQRLPRLRAQGQPEFNHNGHRVTPGIHPDGESGRKWIHPWHFVRVCARSSSNASAAVNILWPFVPIAIAFHFAQKDPLWIFILNYIAMVPSANLVGFAGQELARKLPKVMGVILETFLGSVVEIVLFMVLLHNSQGNSLIAVIQAAILGSILANLLLCLGLCFFVGGIRRNEQEFDPAISEVSNGLLLVAGFGLLIPTAFHAALQTRADAKEEGYTQDVLNSQVLTISRATAVILLLAFIMHIWFQMRSHHDIYAELLELDEQRDEDRHIDLKKDKLTFTECLLALVIALTCVSMHAVFLVQQIEYIVNERHISDQFIGLILVPLVEKAAEHLTAIDEAWDNQMNFALVHVLGATIQTALLNSSLVVIVGWGLSKPMDLDFEMFMVVCLILAIIVVGNFLRDGKSNYLEGGLCVLVYIIIAITTFYYPNPVKGSSQSSEVASSAPPIG